MQEKYIKINNLQVSEKLSNFVNDELLKNTSVSAKNFWLGLEKTLDELMPKNKELIKFREELQKEIDDWHLKNKGKEFNLNEYKKGNKMILNKVLFLLIDLNHLTDTNSLSGEITFVAPKEQPPRKLSGKRTD